MAWKATNEEQIIHSKLVSWRSSLPFHFDSQKLLDHHKIHEAYKMPVLCHIYMSNSRFLKQTLGSQQSSIFKDTWYLTLDTLRCRCKFSAMVKPCSCSYLLYFPGSKLHLCSPQYSPSSMSSRMCCIFLWNTSEAKHNLNDSLRKLFLRVDVECVQTHALFL